MSGIYLKLFVDCLDKCQRLKDAEFGRLIRAALHYKATGEEIELEGREELLWDGIKLDIDRDNRSYNAQVEANRENGKLGGRPRKANESENNRMGFLETEKSQDKDKDKDKDKEENKKESAQARDFEIDAEKGKNNVAQSKRPKNNYEGMINAYTQNEGVRKALWEYLKMRTKKRAAPTDHAFELILKHLSEMTLIPDEQIAILNKSIISNWTDIFPLKPQTGGTNNGQPNRELSDWSDRKSSERTVTQNNGNNDESQYGKTY